MGGPRHVLHAAGDDNIGIAQHDGLGGKHDGLHAGSAQLIDGEGGLGDGDAAPDGGLAGDTLPSAGRQNAAHDDFVHLVGDDLSARNGLADDEGAELAGLLVGQCAHEGTDGRTACGHYDNITWVHRRTPPEGIMKSNNGHSIHRGRRRGQRPVWTIDGGDNCLVRTSLCGDVVRCNLIIARRAARNQVSRRNLVSMIYDHHVRTLRGSRSGAAVRLAGPREGFRRPSAPSCRA